MYRQSQKAGSIGEATAQDAKEIANKAKDASVETKEAAKQAVN